MSDLLSPKTYSLDHCTEEMYEVEEGDGEYVKEIDFRNLRVAYKQLRADAERYRAEITQLKIESDIQRGENEKYERCVKLAGINEFLAHMRKVSFLLPGRSTMKWGQVFIDELENKIHENE